MATQHEPEKEERQQEQERQRQHESDSANDHTIIPAPAPETLPTYVNEKDSSAISFNGNGKVDIDSEDRELGNDARASSEEGEERERAGTMRRLYNKYRIFVHLFFGLVMTGFVARPLLCRAWLNENVG